MKKIKGLKKLLVVMIGLVLILACSNKVFATDDDSLFTAINKTDNSSTESGSDGNNTSTSNSISTSTNNTNSTLTSTNSSTNSTNTNTGSNTTRNVSNTSSNINKNTNTNTNTNQLAKTGLSDNGEIIALIVIICTISAIYSYKKVDDYKKL